MSYFFLVDNNDAVTCLAYLKLLQFKLRQILLVLDFLVLLSYGNFPL